MPDRETIRRRRPTYELIDSLFAELEQAERQRDNFERVARERAEDQARLIIRLAKADRLVEALRKVTTAALCTDEGQEIAFNALAAWESE